MSFESLYIDAIDKRYEELMVKNIVSTFAGINIYESHEEHFNRLNIIHSNLLKRNGQDTVFAYFKCTLEKIISRTPPIPSKLVFDFALEKFKNKKHPEGFLDEWVKKPKELIVDGYIEYKAYDLAINELYNIINPIIDTGDKGLGENIDSGKNLNIKNSNKADSSKYTKILWTGTDEQLVKLYNSLYLIKVKEDKMYFKSNFIDCPDYKTFELNFKGKNASQKIIWLKTLGELVFLMDNLSVYVNNFIYQKENNKIKPIIKNHFSYLVNGKLKNIIEDQTIYDARSRFEISLENDNIAVNKSSKILSIIQGI